MCKEWGGKRLRTRHVCSKTGKTEARSLPQPARFEKRRFLEVPISDALIH